nr:MAG TPA: hypothetical protein [Bacteriophage sp.]DAY73111.1 MAG TPA: hypothetical protein [Caudoviricetes sp.]
MEFFFQISFFFMYSYFYPILNDDFAYNILSIPYD